jgi:hypothetical protein
MRNKLIGGAIMAALLVPGMTLAQARSEVTFAAGNFGTMVSGTISGDEYIDFILRASAGQKMFVDLSVTDSNGSGAAFFNILPPGSSGEAIYNGSIDGNTATVTLPTSGEYTIRVYLMGDDADSGKTTGFNVDLSIQ